MQPLAPVIKKLEAHVGGACRLVGEVVRAPSKSIDGGDVSAHARRDKYGCDGEVLIVTASQVLAVLIGGIDRGIYHSVSGVLVRLLAARAMTNSRSETRLM